MLQEHLDLNGAVLDLVHNHERPGLEWVIRIVTSTACTAFEAAVQSQELVSKIQWYNNDVFNAKFFSFLIITFRHPNGLQQ